MFDPPEELHARFEAALTKVTGTLGARHALYVNGADVAGATSARRVSPIDRDVVLGDFAVADSGQADTAMLAAREAFPGWRAMPARERAAAMRRVAEVMEARVYDIAAALVLEVGKNRMEALGEAQECVDFFRYYADDFEQHVGFDHVLPNDPLPTIVSRNRSVLRPHGVWGIVAPFNFPIALAAGPTAAALVTGNTVVVKGSTDTPWAGRWLADCIRDADLPAGVFNYLSGSGADVGEAMVEHPALAGLTFTGSVAVGRELLRRMVAGAYPRPCIAEMGGKNPCIVTRRANLDDAAAGIVRSAYGMGGQKCSALSRLYVETSVADELIERLQHAVGALRVGDPRRREHWLGPVVNERAYRGFKGFMGEMREADARVMAGGECLRNGDLERGFYVAPTLVELPATHRLWRHELLLPILTLRRVADRDEAMRLANDSDMGLTAGFYGAPDEVPWFHDHIEAGVTYANRPQGATTGAWPGYQPFGGWKNSGSTGKAIASFYYLPQYLREQSRTVVEST
jgi:1-pyrroline-5-carboxylate dehydrogenase